MAIEQLHIDLFASGDMYEGDLLKVTLLSKKKYWQTHPHEKAELQEICAIHFHKIHNHYESGSILRGILDAYEEFRK